MDVSFFLSPYSPQILLSLSLSTITGSVARTPVSMTGLFFSLQQVHGKFNAFQLNNGNDFGFTCLIVIYSSPGLAGTKGILRMPAKAFLFLVTLFYFLTNLICTKLVLNALHRNLLQMLKYGAEKGPLLLSFSLTHPQALSQVEENGNTNLHFLFLLPFFFSPLSHRALT